LKRASILSILLIIALVFAGCVDKAVEETTETTPSNIDLTEFDEDIQELLTRNDDLEEPKPSSLGIINKALEEEKITKEESVVLSYAAILNPESLPSEYQGEIPEHIGDGAMIELEYWLLENWDSLSDEYKEKLEPFYLPAFDPDSFWNPLNEEKQENLLKRLEIIPSVTASNGLKVIEISVEGQKVKIGYKDNAAQAERAKWVNESLQKAWPKFKALLGKEPTDTIYLMLTNTGPKMWGYAIRKPGDGANRCYVQIIHNKDEKITKAITAHELFHCFQYYIPLPYTELPRKWMMETTATYAEHWIYPDYNVEWRFLPGFFKLLDEDLIQWDREKEYTRYTWYYFLMQMTGDLNMIKKNLFDVKTKDARLVIKDTPSFEMLFAEYALWNWNQDPEIRYQGIPTGTWKGQPMKPNDNSYEDLAINTKKETSQSVDEEPLSMKYRSYVFTNNIDKITFKFDKLNDKLHKRQALIKIGDIWHWEDWTEIQERKFCRTRETEEVKAVVLILSNADHDKSHFFTEKYKIDTRGKCNPAWHGTTRWSWSHGAGFQALSASHTLGWTSHMISNDILVYDEDEDEFYVKDQHISYYYNKHHIVSSTADCGVLFSKDSLTYRGSTHNKWEIDEKYPSMSDAPTRLRVSDDEAFAYDASIDVLDHTKEWITTISSDSTRRKACALEGLFTPSAGSYIEATTYYDKASSFRDKPYGITAKLSDDGKRIQGSEMQEMGSGDELWHALIEVDYRYG
jgi:hypothetical protein